MTVIVEIEMEAVEQASIAPAIDSIFDPGVGKWLAGKGFDLTRPITHFHPVDRDVWKFIQDKR